MDFGTLLQTAKENKDAGKREVRYYSTKFAPPKKEEKKAKTLSANIQKFLARKEAEEKKKTLEANKKRDELLALRSKDKKAQRRVNVMLKRTKSANQSVIEDAVDKDNTAVTLAGPSQPDEDDYGYVSQEAAAFYNKMMEKYNKMPDDPKFPTSRKKASSNLSSTKDRVKAALEREREEAMLPHRRKRKHKEDANNHINEPDDGQDEQEMDYEERDVTSTKVKPKSGGPPPMNFSDLLKLAAQKQHEPIMIEVKPKEEEGPLMTKRQKREFEREQQRKEAKNQNKTMPEKLNAQAVSKIPKVSAGQPSDNKLKQGNVRVETNNYKPKVNEASRYDGKLPKLSAQSNISNSSIKSKSSSSSSGVSQNSKSREKVNGVLKSRAEINSVSTNREEVNAAPKNRVEANSVSRNTEGLNMTSRNYEEINNLSKTRNGATVAKVQNFPSRSNTSTNKLIPVKQKSSDSIDKYYSGGQPGGKKLNPPKITERKLLHPKNASGNSLTLTAAKSVSKSVPIEDKYKRDLKYNDSPKNYDKLKSTSTNRTSLDDRRPKHLPPKDMKSKQLPPPDTRPKQFPPPDVRPKQFPPPDVRPKQFPPPDVRRKDFPPRDVKRKPLLGNKRRILNDDDDEYDSEMDDFIDDDVEEVDYSSYIKDIFGYDRNKYRGIDESDVDNMETTFAQQMKEDVRSTKLGIMEDLEDIKREKEEKRRKALLKKRKLM